MQIPAHLVKELRERTGAASAIAARRWWIGWRYREGRSGALAQLFNEVCWNLHGWLLCTHFLFFLGSGISLPRLLVRFDACVCKMAGAWLCHSAGLLKSYASAICLPGFLVGRNGCFRRLESLRRFRGHFAFNEIAFLASRTARRR